MGGLTCLTAFSEQAEDIYTRRGQRRQRQAETTDILRRGAHLNGISELKLVENEGDKVPAADSPSDHQLPAQVQNSHLQQHPRDLQGNHGMKRTAMVTWEVLSPRHMRQIGGRQGQASDSNTAPSSMSSSPSPLAPCLRNI